MHQDLTTPRLYLRQLRPGDAPRVQMLCGNWNVARMLSRVPHPYEDGMAEAWIAEQPEAWRDGRAYIFAIDFAGDLVGVIGVEQREDEEFELDYWLGEPWWGQGVVSEAVARIVRFARDDVGLTTLVSSYFNDNPASGQIQEKIGFRVTGPGTIVSRARGGEVAATYTVLRLTAPC